MNKTGLLYSVPHGEAELFEAAELFSELREGSEPYIHIALDGMNAAECFLLGKDKSGTVEEVIFCFGGTGYVFKKDKKPEVFGEFTMTPDGEVSGTPLCAAELNGKAPDGGVPVRLLEGTEIIGAYELITGGKMTEGDSVRYVFRVRASNRGAARVFGVFNDKGILTATASVVAENEKYALIGDVFTAPDCRGKGLAGALCAECCRFSLSCGKTPWLLCEEKMLPFYENMGFKRIS